jgi:[methyl-Co(III) methanol-specific corrinoid protein]:coenzyme M methyltransferase
MADIASTPERYIDFVVFVARWSSFLASHFAEVGADVIIMVDDEANDSILGAEMFESFAHPAQRKVADAIRSAGALSILHICGDVRSTTDAMVRSGVDAISIGSEMSMTGTRGIVKDRCRIIGNIDPVKVLLNGTPKKVEAEVKRCIKEGVDIVAPSCGLSPKTPLANLQAMTDAIRKHGHIKGLETPRKRQGVGQDPIPERIRNR